MTSVLFCFSPRAFFLFFTQKLLSDSFFPRSYSCMDPLLSGMLSPPYCCTVISCCSANHNAMSFMPEQATPGSPSLPRPSADRSRLIDLVTSDPMAAEVKWTLFCSALASRQRANLLKPYPPGFAHGDGDVMYEEIVGFW